MAGNTTSKRVSVKQYQVVYLESFAAEIGTDDLSEILNWVLTDYCNLHHKLAKKDTLYFTKQ